MFENNNHELSARLRESNVFLFRNFLTNEHPTSENEIPSLDLVLSEIRRVVQQAPLFTPRMYDSSPFRYRMTNCGDFGWLASPPQNECKTTVKKGYYYDRINPYTGQPWPKMPFTLRTASRIAAARVGHSDFTPEVCLINFYCNYKERLGIHQDNSERNFEAPIVSFSIGDSAIFQLGGLEKNDPLEDLILTNGDCLVLAGKSRLFYHKMARIIPGTSPILASAGRVNLTIRQIN